MSRRRVCHRAGDGEQSRRDKGQHRCCKRPRRPCGRRWGRPACRGSGLPHSRPSSPRGPPGQAGFRAAPTADAARARPPVAGAPTGRRPALFPGAASFVHRGPGRILPDRVGIVGLCRWGAPLVEGWGPAAIADRRRPRSASPSAVGTTKGSGVGFEASGVEPQTHQRSGEGEASDRGVAGEAVRAAGRDVRGLAGASRRTGPPHHTLRPADGSWPAGPGSGRGEAAVGLAGQAERFVTARLQLPPGQRAGRQVGGVEAEGSGFRRSGNPRSGPAHQAPALLLSS